MLTKDPEDIKVSKAEKAPLLEEIMSNFFFSKLSLWDLGDFLKNL